MTRLVTTSTREKGHKTIYRNHQYREILLNKKQLSEKMTDDCVFHSEILYFTEQELITLPEHLSSVSVFSWVRVAQSVVFCIMFCRSVCLLCICVLSVFLRFTASDYHMGMFKLFLSHYTNILSHCHIAMSVCSCC